MNILPPPQKDGEIKFFMAKGLPYRARMGLVFGLLVCGLGVQLTLGFWPGFIVLLFAQLLGMNSGYDAAPRTTGAESWVRVTPDEYVKVRRRADELKRWDEDFFDATSTSGLAGLIVTALICAIAYGIAAATFAFPDGSWLPFGLDAAVLLLPLWFIGTREYLKKDKLIIKINALENVMAALKPRSDVQVQPMLSLAETKSGGKEPEDARLMVKLVGAPEAFYGVQVQLSINSVQGKDFPYLYCVVLAKNGFGLLKDYESLLPANAEKGLMASVSSFLFGGIQGPGGGDVDLVYEPSSERDVDLIVVRRRTTRQSGYYTPPSAAMQVADGALRLAKALAARGPA
ncbi:MAG: hypothetical protein M0011_10990 [Elusimicrobia bacterium]|nr:hypothetical protein [Elusimicrobiota bacterium]